MLAGMLALVLLEAWLAWDNIVESGYPRVFAVCLRFVAALIFVGYSIAMCCVTQAGFYLYARYDPRATPLFM